MLIVSNLSQIELVSLCFSANVEVEQLYSSCFTFSLCHE
jgi:hypothetical protein